MKAETSLIEFPKELAATELARASDARKSLIAEHSSSFKWLLASFLALNSGGLFLLRDIKPHNTLWLTAGICFYLGITFALTVAWLGQRTNRAGLTQIAELESLWATTAATGSFDSVIHKQVTGKLKGIGAGPGRWFGWLSFIAFSAGLLFVGCHAIGETEVPTKQTLVHDR